MPRGSAVRAVPQPGRYQIDSGTLEVARDLDRANGWLLSVDDIPQSYVDLDDPTYLEFEYVRVIAEVIDCMRPARLPIDVVHIGGGGFTLPRYIAATRPGSRQFAYEPDGRLVELVRRHFDLRSVPGLRIRVADAAVGVPRRTTATQDLVVVDAFTGSDIPAHLTTVGFVRAAAGLLQDGGIYAANIVDARPLDFARAAAATLRAVLRHVVVIAEPAVLRMRRYGNLVLVGSTAPLPLDELTRRAAAGSPITRVVQGESLRRFVSGAKPIVDPHTAPRPASPDFVFRVRSLRS